MAGVMTKKVEQQIARPLAVLVPLIQDDLKHGDEAGLIYYRAAGEKLIEAREQMTAAEFMPWATRNFERSETSIRRYMNLAPEPVFQKNRARSFSSMREEMRARGINAGGERPGAWSEPVREIVSRVDTDTLNRRRAELERAEESAAQRKLALQLIDIGYRVLARKLHPDKGGSRVAMARLNAVRARLKACL